ncbi:MAG TPA: gliding motility-associated ABC transporter substrate-binding protein GldG [Bacteroidales bacterium]|nr:gliding motility-associated ABC transporter substrate-binding protein GldG [Bacteroidales bacterium]HCB60773.1 gliding motility-associated ABC transporter substrate-binding protein GldG [Bacteroidales bacterium]HCY23502.1 gliding motility-associated ABC transporter substrate-binding protein GldG [Bacteroidales bacterium]
MVRSMEKKTNHGTNRKRSLIRLFAGIAILIVLNLAGTLGFFRLDLTQEKRYTLSDNTIDLLRKVDDIVYFRIYLDGELPASYTKLRNSIRETLDDFRAYNKANIQYEFIDPAEGKDKRTLNDYYNELVEKGLQPAVDRQQNNSSSEQRIIWPCALVSYKTSETPVNFIQTGQQTDKEVLINESLESLEFNLIDAVRRLFVREKPNIAFIDGHGESSAMMTEDITRSLSDYYKVQRVTINQQLKSLDNFKTIIIAGPDSVFDEKDKFVIDQFIMDGGRVLWLVDGTATNMDSLQSSSETVAIANEINLEDMLFKYGVRINNNLLLDMNSCPIPVKTGQIGDQPQFEYFNWFYFPSVSNSEGHPIVKNLNAIRFEFVSGIDTVGTGGVKKTILLSTSEYSRIMNTPAVISLRMLTETPGREFFNKPKIPVAVLLEGNFNSVFTNRIPPEIAEDKEIGFSETGKPSKMIVISDGDIINNQFVYRNGQNYTYPLGYDRFTGINYGNKDFLLNCVNYLTDESNLLEIRSRELKIRLLDKSRIASNKAYIQWSNVLGPVLIIVAIGLVLMIFRKIKLRKGL